ncbi:membrane protein insertion efficiency factor YidD [Ruminococcus sp. FC2018]|uniref:membrane protein insertion efficiency factor YidD n=1 Tax=Ruminococcus sp. FC2018 TaxID=1410617 RepID=UPI00048D76C4|nr:membrane protein insertion efficiency factor YidD [Ruminococcus sp. FC2018]
MKYIGIFLVGLYRRFISPLFPARCKYYPSCSAYSAQAFRMHGFFKGLLLTVWRLLRCNPWSLGGVDYVPKKLSFGYFKIKRKKDRIKDI